MELYLHSQYVYIMLCLNKFKVNLTVMFIPAVPKLRDGFPAIADVDVMADRSLALSGTNRIPSVSRICWSFASTPSMRRAWSQLNRLTEQCRLIKNIQNYSCSNLCGLSSSSVPR
jgi:hypothetical protein